MRKIKVIHLIEDLKTGGAERVLANIVTRLNKEKYEVEVWCLVRGGKIAEELREKRIKVRVLNLSTYHDPLNILKLTSLLRREKVNILHTSGYFASTFGRISGLLVKVPIVFAHPQSTYFYYQKKHLLTENFLSRFTDKIICCSEAVKNWAKDYERIRENKLITIYNGINLEEFKKVVNSKEVRKELSLTGKERIIGTVGRLEPVKNPDLLLRATSLVKKRFPNLKVLFVGKGSLRDSLEKLAEGLGLKENIIFAGEKKNVFPFLSLMEVFILCSNIEGLSLALIEAMSAGIPVIGTKVGGIPEIIENGINGILIPPDNPEAFAEAIIYLLNHPEEAKKMGERGKEICKNKFSSEMMVEKIEELYEHFIKRRR
ncbi:MAG: glycosyltransferase [Halanaerobiales bacterium]|nr:glycosyltransferase [Halanaerobiales bacterium]